MRRSWLRTLGECTPTVCSVGAVCILALSAWQVSRALGDAHRVFVMQESVVASIVAEAAAFTASERVGHAKAFEPFTIASPTGMTSSIESAFVQLGVGLRIEVTGREGRSYVYRCELLPGSAPQCMGNPLSVRHSLIAARPSLQAWLAQNLEVYLSPMADEQRLSTLLDPAVTSASSLAVDEGVIENESIALLRLRSGTDREDFTLGELNSNRWRPRVPPSGVIVIDGNLWVDHGAAPLEVRLSKSLTVVVDGNIYLGRSVSVRGPGRLILVARRGDYQSFRDRDGDGGWSEGDELLGDAGGPYRGPIEGAGMVYLGLPGIRHRPAPQLEIVGSLVAGGEIYVRAESASVHGALVAEQGITWFDAAELHLPAARLPNIRRDRIPGFRRDGVPRPGILAPSQ